MMKRKKSKILFCMFIQIFLNQFVLGKDLPGNFCRNPVELSSSQLKKTLNIETADTNFELLKKWNKKKFYNKYLKTKVPIYDNEWNFISFTEINPEINNQFKFNDPKHDLICIALGKNPASLKIKHWTKTEVLNCINDRVNEALEKHHQSKIKKVSLKKLHMIYKESILGLFDFYESCHVNEFNYFENVIYNKMDFGNYLWGAAMEKLKISNFNTWLGSNLNAILAGKNQTRHFVKFHLKDSREDQKAIFRGKKWYQGAK